MSSTAFAGGLAMEPPAPSAGLQTSAPHFSTRLDYTLPRPDLRVPRGYRRVPRRDVWM